MCLGGWFLDEEYVKYPCTIRENFLKFELVSNNITFLKIYPKLPYFSYF